MVQVEEREEREKDHPIDRRVDGQTDRETTARQLDSQTASQTDKHLRESTEDVKHGQRLRLRSCRASTRCIHPDAKAEKTEEESQMKPKQPNKSQEKAKSMIER